MRLLKKNWRKIKLSEKKPKIKGSAVKYRRCISCGKMFKSTGPGNRFCIICKDKVNKEFMNGSEKKDIIHRNRRGKAIS